MTDSSSRVCQGRLAGLLSVIFLALASSTAAGVTIGPPQKIGTLTDGALPEVSGLVVSRAFSDTFWIHNDGSAPQFFAVSASGTLLGTFPLDGATASDVEDIAIGARADGGNYLYLGDIGDNDGLRPSIKIFRIDEPETTTGGTIPASSYTTLTLQYPNSPRDAESMFVDPLTGDLFLITKRTSVPEIYSVSTAAFDNPSQTATLTALGALGGGPLHRPSRPTAADISPDGRFILVRNSDSLKTGYLYERGAGQSVADALHVEGIPFALGEEEEQGEAIGWAPDEKSFFTTSEKDGGPTAPIYSYAFTALPALLAGDYNNDYRVDATDYTVWRDQLGSNIALPNEADTPGVVTTEDYDVWLAHFGESASGGGAVTKSTGTLAEVVPEPASWALVVSALLSFASAAGTRPRSR